MLVSRGLSLKATMDGYEQRIAQVNKNPESNKRELDSLIGVLEKTKNELAQIKGNVRESDFGSFIPILSKKPSTKCSCGSAKPIIIFPAR